MRGKRRPLSKARITKRREKSLELRQQGYTFQDIGQILGVSWVQSRRDVMAGLDEAAKKIRESSEHILAVHMGRLERAIQSMWPAIESGDLEAIRTMTKVLEREAKLLGIDAPAKTESRMDISAVNHQRDMHIVLNDPEAKMALDAYNDAVYRARDRVSNESTNENERVGSVD